ncbi:low molecular weight phosphotyrosine protein phosphatase-like protein [Lophiostoma macrostomum CBS 122681]|uniref:Low molecular weight phosphotyrosine protein phosphatase-like protein n=1 Tax=Lophiostoma macrostomum CBS 122681 TaxID=1314788 RepID=A0A6A6T3W0_9PLEO|nr:low molecular weight phosphotyrosine protein phosphatase-like protein [Lophiostoma macrostomum CBS 122681]
MPAESSPTPKPVAVLFVCLGNICRSTMAEGVFQSLTHPANQTPHPLISHIDSCGTGAYHTGGSPDSRTMATLRSKGITSYTHRARKFRTQDFSDFDYILAMDDDNLEDLQHLRVREVKRNGGEEGVGQVMLFGEFGGKRRMGGRRKAENGGKGRGEEIVDPYYGGDEGFQTAYEQAVRFSQAFIGQLEAGELS